MLVEKPKAFASDVYRETVLQALFAGAWAHLDDMRRVDRAHATMLAEQGIISRNDAVAILTALDGLHIELKSETHTDAGQHEDLFFLREARLIAAVGEDRGGSLHLARSRNDLEATLFKLSLKRRLREALQQLARLLEVLVSVAQRERETIIVAYTHGQPAQPTTFGHYLAAMIEVQLRHAERLLAAYGIADLCPLGAAAITTSGFPVDRQRVASLLGFADVQENSYGCIAAVDYLTATFSALKLSLIDIGRLCQDFAFWCGFEVGQLRAPDGYVQISSIMPQKRNPLAIENARTLASIAVGQCETVIGTVHNTPFADMVDAEAPTQRAGSDAFDTFARLTKLLTGFVPGLSVNHAAVRRNIEASGITLTELADTLVREDGISFRMAHHVTSHLAQLMMRESLTMSQLTVNHLQQAFQKFVGRRSSLDDEALRHAVRPETFIAVRETFGGPGPDALNRSLAGYAVRLTSLKDAGNALSRQETLSLERLDAAIASL
jgi:argininosuccinate lyase